MKKQRKIWIISMLAASLLVVGCDDDEDNDQSPAAEKVYTLAALDNSGVSGTVTFTKQGESTTKVLIQVSGTTEGNSHPAHIHSNAASAGGPIVVDLNPVDGATGRSETMVSRLNDGTAITYDELVNFNGHVNVHKSATELGIMLAQGDIGANASGSSSGGNGYN
jgi:hypothetical protein